jgi:hypothetical protein
MRGMVRYPFAAALLAMLFGMAACCSAPKRDAGQTGLDTAGLSAPFFDPDVNAVCDPPLGWNPQALKSTPDHNDQVWLSPTGDTAYGVIHFRMPFPVGQSLAFAAFLSHMKKTEGDATLFYRQDDPGLPGIRFVAQGGIYVIRANLLVSAWDGWAVYAGTLKSGRILPNELDFAVRAREHTRVGRPQTPGN